MKVTNMLSPRTGKPVANQYIIENERGTYFQSYNSIIAFRPFDGSTIQLDEDKWDYSRTTSKYRSAFLRETTDETRRKIKEGAYKLVNLN